MAGDADWLTSVGSGVTTGVAAIYFCLQWVKQINERAEEKEKTANERLLAVQEERIKDTNEHLAYVKAERERERARGEAHLAWGRDLFKLLGESITILAKSGSAEATTALTRINSVPPSEETGANQTRHSP